MSRLYSVQLDPAGPGTEDKESFKFVSEVMRDGRDDRTEPRCCLSVSKISYSVSERVGPWWDLPSYRKRWTRQILNDVSFHVDSGQIMGILGNSGSGKTTLLDAISGRIGNSGTLSGEVFVNGRKLAREEYQDCFSYVLQSDNLLSYLTVEETLTYTAQLALRKHSAKAIHKKVFSRIAVMSRGELVFCGQPEEMVDFFSQCGYECPEYCNPFDIYVDFTSVDTRSSEREAATFSRMHEITCSYQGSAIYRHMLGKMTQSLQRHDKAAIPFKSKESPGGGAKLGVLLRRTMRNLSRDRMGVLMRLSQNLIYGLFVAFFVMHLDMDVTKGAVQDRIGIIYQSIGASPYTGMLNAVALFPALRAIGDQESQDGLYSKWQMFLAYIFHILPFSVISVFIFTSFLYWTVGMHPETWRFLSFTAVVMVPHIIGELLTVVLLGVVQDPNMVNTGVALLNIAGILVGSGFLRSMAQMPTVFQWLSYLTFQKYSCELLIVTEFHDLHFTCNHSRPFQGDCIVTQGNQIIDEGYPGALSRYILDFVLLYTFLPALLLLGMVSFKIRDRLVLH
ncbi:ATP-binding cassette sub-family G member 5 isoform X3 [Nerophis ophidion]|uniref:ATP-binding cassette sub-family G member 5-like isoform X3 n=1 Tax=Nerophis ophidion TaxID=159077 RepID=UPI002ADF5628|nr:ATP-binding cassette sub-family G member 5-like isoform X3 [Nerophis ophidion]XP_061767182.1 ATP-binding cassette sub-family G member 5 isoform X3 [Nerophis ophidion]